MGKINDFWNEIGYFLFPGHCDEVGNLRCAVEIMRHNLDRANDELAAKTLELESLKNKIVERAQVQPIIRAKSAAEIRRMVEAQNEREFEESANGI